MERELTSAFLCLNYFFLFRLVVRTIGTSVVVFINRLTKKIILNHSSMRRGYQVYKQVCSACHSMRYLPYYDLIDATHSRDEAKAEAAEVMVSTNACVYRFVNRIIDIDIKFLLDFAVCGRSG